MNLLQYIHWNTNIRNGSWVFPLHFIEYSRPQTTPIGLIAIPNQSYDFKKTNYYYNCLVMAVTWIIQHLDPCFVWTNLKGLKQTQFRLMNVWPLWFTTSLWRRWGISLLLMETSFQMNFFVKGVFATWSYNLTTRSLFRSWNKSASIRWTYIILYCFLILYITIVLAFNS